MAYFSLNDSRPKTVRIRKDLLRVEAVRDFEFQTKRHFYDLPEKLEQMRLVPQDPAYEYEAISLN